MDKFEFEVPNKYSLTDKSSTASGETMLRFLAVICERLDSIAKSLIEIKNGIRNEMR